jgi:uncharacterized membrane protein
MPRQQRMMRVEQRSQLAAMQRLESRSDEELEAESKYRAAAQAILGARAAERYDAAKARAHFQKALAAARGPQERLHLRRMADASLALAERRAGDLQAAAERLGVEPLSKGQLRGLRFMGLVAPPKSAGIIARIRGIAVIILLIAAVCFAAFGIVTGIADAAGGLKFDLRIFWSILLVVAAVIVLVVVGRRRQKAARAKRDEQLAARRG